MNFLFKTLPLNTLLTSMMRGGKGSDDDLGLSDGDDGVDPVAVPVAPGGDYSESEAEMSGDDGVGSGGDDTDSEADLSDDDDGVDPVAVPVAPGGDYSESEAEMSGDDGVGSGGDDTDSEADLSDDDDGVDPVAVPVAPGGDYSESEAEMSGDDGVGSGGDDTDSEADLSDGDDGVDPVAVPVAPGGDYSESEAEMSGDDGVDAGGDDSDGEALSDDDDGVDPVAVPAAASGGDYSESEPEMSEDDGVGSGGDDTDSEADLSDNDDGVDAGGDDSDGEALSDDDDGVDAVAVTAAVSASDSEGEDGVETGGDDSDGEALSDNDDGVDALDDSDALSDVNDGVEDGVEPAVAAGIERAGSDDDLTLSDGDDGVDVEEVNIEQTSIVSKFNAIAQQDISNWTTKRNVKSLVKDIVKYGGLVNIDHAQFSELVKATNDIGAIESYAKYLCKANNVAIAGGLLDYVLIDIIQKKSLPSFHNASTSLVQYGILALQHDELVEGYKERVESFKQDHPKRDYDTKFTNSWKREVRDLLFFIENKDIPIGENMLEGVLFDLENIFKSSLIEITDPKEIEYFANIKSRLQKLNTSVISKRGPEYKRHADRLVGVIDGKIDRAVGKDGFAQADRDEIQDKKADSRYAGLVSALEKFSAAPNSQRLCEHLAEELISFKINNPNISNRDHLLVVAIGKVKDFIANEKVNHLDKKRWNIVRIEFEYFFSKRRAVDTRDALSNLDREFFYHFKDDKIPGDKVRLFKAAIEILNDQLLKVREGSAREEQLKYTLDEYKVAYKKSCPNYYPEQIHGEARIGDTGNSFFRKQALTKVVDVYKEAIATLGNVREGTFSPTKTKIYDKALDYLNGTLEFHRYSEVALRHMQGELQNILSTPNWAGNMPLKQRHDIALNIQTINQEIGRKISALGAVELDEGVGAGVLAAAPGVTVGGVAPDDSEALSDVDDGVESRAGSDREDSEASLSDEDDGVESAAELAAAASGGSEKVEDLMALLDGGAESGTDSEALSDADDGVELAAASAAAAASGGSEEVEGLMSLLDGGAESGTDADSEALSDVDDGVESRAGSDRGDSETSLSDVDDGVDVESEPTSDRDELSDLLNLLDSGDDRSDMGRTSGTHHATRRQKRNIDSIDEDRVVVNPYIKKFFRDNNDLKNEIRGFLSRLANDHEEAYEVTSDLCDDGILNAGEDTHGLLLIKNRFLEEFKEFYNNKKSTKKADFDDTDLASEFEEEFSRQCGQLFYSLSAKLSQRILKPLAQEGRFTPIEKDLNKVARIMAGSSAAINRDNLSRSVSEYVSANGSEVSDFTDYKSEKMQGLSNIIISARISNPLQFVKSLNLVMLGSNSSDVRLSLMQSVVAEISSGENELSNTDLRILTDNIMSRQEYAKMLESLLDKKLVKKFDVSKFMDLLEDSSLAIGEPKPWQKSVLTKLSKLIDFEELKDEFESLDQEKQKLIVKVVASNKAALLEKSMSSDDIEEVEATQVAVAERNSDTTVETKKKDSEPLITKQSVSEAGVRATWATGAAIVIGVILSIPTLGMAGIAALGFGALTTVSKFRNRSSSSQSGDEAGWAEVSEPVSKTQDDNWRSMVNERRRDDLEVGGRQ